MLDDLKLIHERDKSDALGIAEKQWQQLLVPADLRGEGQFGAIDNIVYAGMGGSALAASFFSTWPTLTVPFEILRGYDLPSYVDHNTLFIASSYSGNTEETLAALEQAQAKGAQLAIIAGGGKLQQIAEANQYFYAQLPQAAQPRYAVLYSLRASIEVLAAAGVVEADSCIADLEAASTHLQQATAAWRADIPTASNPAKQLAQELLGKSVVVYGGPKMYPAAYKWKISCNENAKQVAWAGCYPEFNHNEFIGWSEQPVDKPYAVIDLRSTLEHPRVQKRFEVSERLLSGRRPAPLVVQVEGRTLLEQLLWAVAYGDFVTLYLALLNGLNPAPVDLVERFKKSLNE
jgi:glucose/mannose-6-phosphate isomerase